MKKVAAGTIATDRRNIRRMDRLLREERHDHYLDEHKPEEPATCPDCGAIRKDGRWAWGKASPGAPAKVCPACRRTRDEYPAGIVTLSGDFVQTHGSDLRNLILSVEKAESEEHPIERIMKMFEDNGDLVIWTTGTHVANRIGRALHKAYEGDLSLVYPPGEQAIDVRWRR